MRRTTDAPARGCSRSGPDLVTVRGLRYLIAYDPDRADRRTFRADRIDDVRRLVRW